jgi:hypothetical protein
LWIFEETIDLFSQQLDWISVDQYFQHLDTNLNIALDGSSSYSRLWGRALTLIDKNGKDDLSSGTLSLFDHKPSPPATNHFTPPATDQLITSVGGTPLLEIILQQIHLLGRYYRQISLHYCELLQILNTANAAEGTPRRDQLIEKWIRILQTLMERIENITKEFLKGWRALIFVCGCSLVNQPLNQSQNRSDISLPPSLSPLSSLSPSPPPGRFLPS